MSGRRSSSSMLEAALETLAARESNPAVVTAVGDLARIDAPRARAALIAELARLDTTTVVREAGAAALALQLAQFPQSLIPLSIALVNVADWLQRHALHEPAAQARELSRAAMGWHAEGVDIKWVPASTQTVTVDPQASDRLHPAVGVISSDAEVGAELEQKVRIHAVRLHGSHMDVVLARDGWVPARRLHLGAAAWLERHGPGGPRYELLEALGDPAYRVPGLASMHVICLTADRRMVVGQRGPASAYAPGAWSATFEEGMIWSDVQQAPAAPVAFGVRRGFDEEFGEGLAAAVRQATITERGVIIEIRHLSLAFICIMELPVDFAAVQACWADHNATLRARAEVPELTDLRGLPEAEWASVAETLPGALHDTTEVRIRALLEHLA